MDTVRCEVMQRKWYGYSASENKINMSAIILLSGNRSVSLRKVYIMWLLTKVCALLCGLNLCSETLLLY